MPSNINLFRRRNNNSVFIETGTCDGAGVRNAIFSGFKEIYSIELAEYYYQYSKSYFKYNDNVHLIFGDTVKELPKILSKLDVSATFWLDAHYSGGDTDFVDVLSPLMKELDIIKEHHIKTHTIIIDDLREWKRDYPAIGFNAEDIRDKILEINPDYRFFYEDGYIGGDILVAEVKSIKPINIVVFSKDRAMQVELLIRSFNRFVAYSDLFVINVLYTYSNDKFKEGYEKLINKNYSNVILHKETDFKKQVLILVDPAKEHTVFFVDDIVFKNPLDFYDKQMDIFNWDESIICRSLRLHRDLSYCYPLQIAIRQPPFLDNNIFNWKKEKGDYGYPMSLDGHIFRTKDIMDELRSFDYKNPNTLEGELTHKKNIAPRMICYDRSIVFSNPLNKVQTVNDNIYGNISAEFLNDKFLEGFIIDLTPFMGFHNRSCHQEVEPTFIEG